MTEELEVHRQSVSRSIQYSDYSSGDDEPITPSGHVPSSNIHHAPAYKVSMASTEPDENDVDDDDGNESSSSFDMTVAAQIERNKQNTKKRVSNAIQSRMSSFQPNTTPTVVSPSHNTSSSSSSAVVSQKEKKKNLASRWQSLMRANSKPNSASSFDMTVAAQIERNKQNTKKRVSNAIQLRMSSFQPNTTPTIVSPSHITSSSSSSSSSAAGSQKEKKKNLASRWQSLMRANSKPNSATLHESQQPIQHTKKPQSIHDGHGSFAINSSSSSSNHSSRTSTMTTTAAATAIDPYKGLSPIQVWKKKKAEREQKALAAKTTSTPVSASQSAVPQAQRNEPQLEQEVKVEVELDEKQSQSHSQVVKELGSDDPAPQQQRYRDDFESELKKLQMTQTETQSRSSEPLQHMHEEQEEEKVQDAVAREVEMETAEEKTHAQSDEDEDEVHVDVDVDVRTVDADTFMEHVYNHFCVDEQRILSGTYILQYMRDQLQLRLTVDATEEDEMLMIRQVMTELFGDDVVGAYGYYIRLRTDNDQRT
eukprot:CAMPEP_0202727770 /NCGR_PEP_ID=MMETSP1385-20130828/185290_1 /ASSEMBLY_ACC=CAM_ASM_000861 /TAXON_ID=933848 /ORGANISM="Elphidium margaritaceum" /LENGTH=535 /DNA_ID=CAMNT_0049394013 /DNA_START=23 /DNA_END=1630 /DNA_ORIENTATION=+